MGVVKVQCPKTGRQVSTGREMDLASFRALRFHVWRFKCPACGSEHAWSKGIAQLVEQRDIPVPVEPAWLSARELAGPGNLEPAMGNRPALNVKLGADSRQPAATPTAAPSS